MHEKIGSLIMDVHGHELTGEDRDILAHPLVGGVILFSRNYSAREQLQHLCQQIHAAKKTPLLIMVDQEGGRVQRFIEEFTRLPSMANFGKIHDSNPILALKEAKNCGWLLASELLSVGVDLSLAPVLDLNKGMSSVIGERAFHADTKVVIALATAFMAGMQEAGMVAVGKHFPGHGSVTLDSHVAMPIDNRSLDEIENDDLQTFVGLINHGMTAVMAAHIIFPQIDSLAVGFSRRWLQDILRSKLGFKGTILSDDLNMEGANISQNYADRVIAAREAGCDFTLLCNNRPGVVQAIDNVSHKEHMVDVEKWGPLQGKFSSVSEPLSKIERWQKTHEFLLSCVQ